MTKQAISSKLSSGLKFLKDELSRYSNLQFSSHHGWAA
jgi:hypothetical protein